MGVERAKTLVFIAVKIVAENIWFVDEGDWPMSLNAKTQQFRGHFAVIPRGIPADDILRALEIAYIARFGHPSAYVYIQMLAGSN